MTTFYNGQCELLVILGFLFIFLLIFFAVVMECLYVVVFPTNQFSVFCLIVFEYIFWRAKNENHVSRTLSMFLLGNLMTTRMLFFTYGVIIVLSTFNNTGTNPSSISLELHSIVQIRVRNEGAEPIAFLRTRGWRSWLESKW